MSSYLTLSSQLRTTDFSECQATVVGYGAMGREYVKALRALGVKKIAVCSRSPEPLQELAGVPDVVTSAGGYQQFQRRPAENELAIIATPISELIPAAHHLRELGFKKFLIEKPIALFASALFEFCQQFEAGEIETACAYNRAAYPALLEAERLAKEEGGITSCTYTFTELIKADWSHRFSGQELARWGIANSLHVISMAHRLIGMPKVWSVYQKGNHIVWHPSGTVFVGAGQSKKNIPFAYHADWGSQSRWSVEFHTPKASYRFCPLEKLYRKTSWQEDWEEIPLTPFAPEVKAGFVEQVAAILSPEIRKQIPLVSLTEAWELIKFGEEVFGYGS